jgi:hypothetical protein
MHTKTQFKADFKGMLLQSRRQPGQKYAVLLFRTQDGLRFCLSKDIKMVLSMQIGQTYHVKGLEYISGHKTYLDIVSSSLVRPKYTGLRKRAGLLASIASLFIIVGSGGTGYVMNHNAQTDATTTPQGPLVDNLKGEKSLVRPGSAPSATVQTNSGATPVADSVQLPGGDTLRPGFGATHTSPVPSMSDATPKPAAGPESSASAGPSDTSTAVPDPTPPPALPPAKEPEPDPTPSPAPPPPPPASLAPADPPVSENEM